MATDERKRIGLVAVAAVVLAVLVVQIAVAGGPSGSTGSDTSASAAAQSKQLKKLKRQVRELREQVEALARQPGPQGVQGPEGPSGLSGVEVVDEASASDSTSPKFLTATCPTGKRVIGTGGEVSGAISGVFPNVTSPVTLRQVRPDGDTDVDVMGVETSATVANWSVLAWAICARVDG